MQIVALLQSGLVADRPTTHADQSANDRVKRELPLSLVTWSGLAVMIVSRPKLTDVPTGANISGQTAASSSSWLTS